MSITTTAAPSSAETSPSGSGGADKDFWDVFTPIIQGGAQVAAQSLGIDPRVAGQTVSQVLSIFGIGGPGKAFTATLPKDQAVSQLKQVVAPHLSDPAFKTAFGKWMEAAIEPVQAHKQGKAYQPSVDLSKDWLSDIGNTIGNAVSSVNWGQVAQVGMQALPFVLSLI